MTLLYVDDDPDDIDVFKDAVQRVAPYCLLYVAKGGKEALVKLDDIIFLPDYIFLDLNMPEITGVDVLKHIRNKNKLKDIPVVVYSTSIVSRDAEECKKLGAVDLVAKATEFHQLCAMLKKFI